MAEPEEVAEWIAVVRDLIIILIATMLFVAQILWLPPSELLIGAGLTLLLSPVALRADAWRRRKREEDDEDVNDGPGGYWRHP